jgi:hypothetical protein
MLSLVFSTALAAGPATLGHQATLGAGAADYTEMRLWFTAREAVFLGEYRYLGERGLVLEGEFSTAVGERTYVGNLAPAWRSDFAGALALRAGYERPWFGLQTGVLYWLDPTEKGPQLSGSLWVGHPMLHLWTERNPGWLIGDLTSIQRGVGLGSTTDSAHVEVGAFASGWGGPVYTFETEGRVRHSQVWIGVRGRYLPVLDQWGRHETRALLTVRFVPDAVF